LDVKKIERQKKGKKSTSSDGGVGGKKRGKGAVMRGQIILGV